MTEEISDVLLLSAFGVLGLLVLLVWLAVGYGLAVLIGRVIRGRDNQVPVEPTREMPFFRMPPTDTVLMERVRR